MGYRKAAKAGFTECLKYISNPLNDFHSMKTNGRPDGKVAILTYHKITDITHGIDAFWNVPPSLFAEHMAYLARSPYEVITLAHLHGYLCRKREIPLPAAVLTFDDGYANFFHRAFPILEMYGFPATVFLTAKFAGNRHVHPWDEPIVDSRPDEYSEVRVMTWSEIETAKTSGLVDFGSHTMTHPHLGLLSSSTIAREVRDSKTFLEKRLARPVDFFAYPGGIHIYGDISDETDRQIKKAGYRLACTSAFGRNDENQDIFRLKRIGIGSKDNLAVFRAKICGALDWVGKAQEIFQKSFSNVY